MRRAISDSAMRPVVIVLLDPTSDRCPRFFQAPILRRPDFLFLLAAMEPFNVTVAFRVMIRRPSVRDAEPCERFQEPRRSELRAKERYYWYLSYPCGNFTRKNRARVGGVKLVKSIDSIKFISTCSPAI